MAKRGYVPAEDTALGTGIDADTLIRTTLFLIVLLSICISFHPFEDRSEPLSAVTVGGDAANQVGFSAIFLALAAWTYFKEPQRLALLLRPALLAMLIWFAITVVASWEPSLAARRLAFTLVLMSIAGMTLLVPKNLRHFSDLMTAIAFIVLAACYLGVFLLPQLAVHQATDFFEPEHAGNWRGVFYHKNEAGAAMVLFIFIGLFVARARSFALGAAIIVLASIFLAFSQSKTAIGVLPLVLLLSAIISRSRRPTMGIALVLAFLLLFNLATLGSVYFEPVRHLIETIMPDSSFTGRTDIWQFALDRAMERPLTGYGLSAFWGTEQVVYGMGENSTWANAATDAHNAYLNLALSAGIPGLVLVVIWIVVLPILDFYHQPRDAHVQPMQLLFLRICLYGVYASCFESSIFQQVGEVWFLFLTSAFGLRYLSLTHVAL